MPTAHRAAVLGRPVQHSLSPVLHQCAYDELGLDDYSYGLFDIGEDELAGFVAERDDSWVGLSLTMPLKEQALLIADSASPIALQTGAVNTLIRTRTGWSGHNTDVAGVLGALGGRLRGRATSAVVIGSGATARSVLAALAQLGLSQVTFVVRSTARESTLAQARDHGLAIDVLPYGQAAPAVLAAPLLVSTVPARAADPVMEAVLGWSREGLPQLPPGIRAARPLWMDVVYAGWPTQVASVGAVLGAEVIGGLDMLVHQAAAQVTLMTGRPAPVAAMLAAGRRALADRQA